MKDYLIEAIRSLKPESEFYLIDNDYSTIKWHVIEGKAPTQSQIDAEMNKLIAEDKIQSNDKAAAKAALLERLGITADEAALLLG